jgi:hypothetical protein
MGDMTMWRYCPFCGYQWQPGDVLENQLASGRIVCGHCGVEWSAPVKEGSIIGWCSECGSPAPNHNMGCSQLLAPAKGAEPKCICIRANIGGGFIHLRGCPIHGDKANPGKWAPDPAAPQFLTMTQPKIDFVLDLSQAEADRLGPPAPRWRCVGCGRELGSYARLQDGEWQHLVSQGTTAEHWCGPIEEQP